ncbi:MAG TPA: DUF5060 domain-containing protein [Polyangiaceae bacterium]|nr:DUF5060 domain-containing protein [Polyangiaceae bacterium]
MPSRTLRRLAGALLLTASASTCSSPEQQEAGGGSGGSAGETFAGSGGSAGSTPTLSGGAGAALAGGSGAPTGGTDGGSASSTGGSGLATAGAGSGGIPQVGAAGASGAPAAGGSAGNGATSGSGNGGNAGSAPGGGAGGMDNGAIAKAWYPQDLTFTSTANKANPYLEVTDFKVTFTGPSGARLVVPGFYTGGQSWKVRFAPIAAGTYTYVTSSAQDPSLNGLTGSAMPAMSNANAHGPLAIDPANPRHYLYADGTRHFQMGYELDWLGLMDFGDPSIPKARAMVDLIAANGFSEVILNAYAHDTTWNSGRTSAYDFGPPALYAWAGTNAAPDHTRMNEAFWTSFDRVMAYLFEKGISAHLFFRVYNKQVKWPANGSAADDLFFRFIVARYQAYSNVVWDFSKESFYEKDHAYIASRFNLIKANDGYQRLRTLHDSDGGQNQLSPNYSDEAADSGTLGLDTDQSDHQSAAAKTALSKRAMPYYNAETTLYQTGNDGTYTYGRHHPKEAVFDASMEVLMAGGYFAFYYSTQAWDVVRWDEVPSGIALYKNLSTFMKGTRWYTMTGSDALIGGGASGSRCLAAPGKEYIVYKNRTGNFTLNIAGAAGPLAARWLNLTTNVEAALPDQSNGTRTFTNPWNAPALLHLVAK